MSLPRQLEYLRDSCIEALETKAKALSVPSVRITDQINLLLAMNFSDSNEDELFELFDQNKKQFLTGSRDWISKAKIIIQGVDVSYCFVVAEDVDSELATLIMYRIYRCFEMCDGIAEEDVQALAKRSSNIKAMLDSDANTSLPVGPAGVELGAIQQNLGGIIQGFLPMLEGLMQSTEFKRVLDKSIPKDSGDSNNPPDISAVIKSTLGIFDSQEGKDLFNKISGSLAPKK